MTVLEPKEAYRLLAPDYDSAPNALIALEQRVLEQFLPDLHERRLVDVGSGTGRWAKYALVRGASVVSVDVCYEMLRRAPRPAVLADACRLPLPDACADLVICAFTLGYAPCCFAELGRIVRPGGLVFVSDVHPGALRRGWKRSFRTERGIVEIAHATYTLEDLTAPELKLTMLLEPPLGLPEKTIFDRAGCPERFEHAARGPAVFVAQFIRTSR
jgi:SAM-dependent methyltransferase